MTPRREAQQPRREPRPERDPAERVLALQRGAGNAAVAQLLRKGKDQRARRRAPAAGTRPSATSPARSGFRSTASPPGTRSPTSQSQSPEGAAGKAVVVVPNSVDVKASPDVLLFFHGMGNLGYRERTKADKSRGPEGTVHDVEVDRIEQQLAHSGQNIIAVLPQGTNNATFGIADPQAYVTEALGKAAAKINVPAITSGGIVSCRATAAAGDRRSPRPRSCRPRRRRPTTNGSTSRRCSSSTTSWGLRVRHARRPAALTSPAAAHRTCSEPAQMFVQ